MFAIVSAVSPLFVPQILPSGSGVHTRLSKHPVAHQLLLAGDFCAHCTDKDWTTQMGLLGAFPPARVGFAEWDLGSLWWFLLAQDFSAKPRNEFWRIWQKRQDGLRGNLSSPPPNKEGFSQPFLWECLCLKEVLAPAGQLLAALLGLQSCSVQGQHFDLLKST